MAAIQELATCFAGLDQELIAGLLETSEHGLNKDLIQEMHNLNQEVLGSQENVQ